MILVDSHCHLDLCKEYDDVANIVAKALASGVQYMQTICTSLDELGGIIEIAEKYDNVFASVGIHPNEVKSVSSYLELVELAQHPKIIGLGETGLDYYRDSSEKKLQKGSFIEHIKASQENNLPVIVHTRDAEADTIDIITSEMRNSPFPGLIHCFTSSKDLARAMLDAGMYISISGIVTFKNASDLQEIVRFLPMDRLLIETDSPYLAPVPMRGKTNMPAFVSYVAEFIAELKGVNKEVIASATTENFFTLFSKARK